MNASSGQKMTKNEKRDAARAMAREMREKQLKAEKRNKVLLFGGSAVVAIALVVGIIALVIGSVPTPGPRPANMDSNGVAISQGFVVDRAPAGEVDYAGTPITADPEGPVLLQVWVDYMCPWCGIFESTNRAQIAEWVEKGAVKVVFYPVSILDTASQGSKYSTRAANAAVAVATYSPDQFWDFHNLLFEKQPDEATRGLSNDEIKDLAQLAKVENFDKISEAIDTLEFEYWISNQSKELNKYNPRIMGDDAVVIPGTTDAYFIGTPTVVINGVKWEGSPQDPSALAAAVLAAAAK
ncbi:MAG: thioredoxin domain-containing protein [Microbacteriaceae bacterium]|nr:thioredoxin domain-containing protein [Microbacteriaceae bacterium]